MIGELGIPAFIAGVLTFIAPCTLPLLPGYLSFISGISLHDLQIKENLPENRRRVFYNGVFYVAGFSLVFIIMGSLFGLGGAALVKYRSLLTQIGGAFVIFFGIYMMGIFRFRFLSFLQSDHKMQWQKNLTPGNPVSSFIFGATFAFGWSPCVGPILGSVLLLASNSGTVAQGAFLLGVFSLGLALPFLVIAYFISTGLNFIQRYSKYLRWFSVLSGAFLVLLGYLLITNNFGAWLAYFYQIFDIFNYDRLLDYL